MSGRNLYQSVSITLDSKPPDRAPSSQDDLMGLISCLGGLYLGTPLSCLNLLR